MNKEEKKYNQILDKKEMSKEEAEKIIDDMYHDKTKVYGEGNVVHVDLIGTVKFTNLEFASVRLLREVVCLENEIRDLYKMMSIKDDEIEELKTITRAYNSYMCDDVNFKIVIADARYFFYDGGYFVDRFISKDKIKEKIKEVENREENYTFDKLTSEDIRRTIITNLKELLGGGL